MMAASISDRLVAAAPWLDGVADVLKKAYEPLLGQDAPRAPRDFLYGTWLGHPLHPFVVTLPIGFWTTSLLLDLMGDEETADRTLAWGLLGAVGAAVTGAAQWQDTVNNEQPRRLGALHASLNIAATGIYAASWALRKGGARPAAVGLAAAGYGVVSASGWLGGELAYVLGIGVDHTAFEKPPREWTDVAAEDDLPENAPFRVEADGVPVMLVKRGARIQAIAATCTHLGGPLDEGELGEDTVTCPWHGSVFCLADGNAKHGPATSSQTTFDVQLDGGRVLIKAREP